MALPNPFMPINITVSKSVSAVPNERTRRVCLISAGDSNIGDGKYEVVDASSWNTKITSDTSEAGKFAKTFFSQNNAQFKSLVVLEVTSSGDIATRLKKVEKFIDDGTYPCWLFHLPSTLLNDAYLGTLLTKYSTDTAQTYFSFVLDDMPAQSAFFNAQAKGKKATFAIYPTNTDTNLNMGGVFGGIIASSTFDISTSNRMRPLGGLKTPVANNVLDTPTVRTLTDNLCNFGGLLSGVQVVLNGVFNDGEYFEKWYSFDTVCNKLISEMEAFYVNSVNLPNSALEYTDTGVKMARDKIISILEACVNLGLISTFGSSLDVVTGQVNDEGSIGWIKVQQYRADNPTDYTAGIYKGFSIFVDIKGFIKQIPIQLSF